MRWIPLLLSVMLVACRADDAPGDTSEGPPVDYVAQTPPGDTAQLFAPGLVSTEHGELNSVFTTDLREFYFTRRGIPGRWPAIMVTRRGPQGWTVPESVGFDEDYSAIDLFITPDGQRMVFCSNRPHRDGDEPRSDHDFWLSLRDESGWGEPHLFAPAALSDWEDYYPVVTESGNLYFNSQREGPGTNNIFRAIPTEGTYGTAEKLPEPINSQHREFDAFVSPTEDMIVFSSDRPGGFGRSDIYVSFLEVGGWSQPRNLGGEVNSEGAEFGAILSPDGRYLFFTSTKGGNEDIYWISAEVLGG